ncbi:MAG: hypothetical protein JO359_09980 [Candidatus Eremiobacteraeota bacterium]|nr:hypothetical protein [Candidatus Eremiobacteraeota bacterium]
MPTAPPTYAALYNAVGTQVSQFSNAVSAQCAGANYPTKIYTILLPADSNGIYSSLIGASPAAVTAMANNAIAFATGYQQRFGITGFRISINYPTLVSNPANLPNSTFTVANYATYLSYYQQVVQGLRAAGLGVDIESNILFPQYAGSQYNFNGLTLPMLEAGLAENGQHIIDNLKPDHLNLGAEPSTIAFQTGFSSVNDPSNYPAYLNAIRSQINNSNPGGTKIGAGSDDWQSNAFVTNLLSMTSLDYYDLHMYPPDYLQNGIADLQQLKASGKPLIVTESWLDKEDAGSDGTSGPIDSQIVFVRNAYSFWGTIDQQYVSSLIQLARCNNVQNLDLSYALMLYTYVDFSPTTANYAYSQMLAALNTSLQAAEGAGTVTPAGQAVQRYTGVTQSALRRR